MADEPSLEPVEAPPEPPTETPQKASSGGFTVSTEGASLMGIVGASAGIGLAAYIIAVALQGNLSKLFDLLKTEEPYLEFAVAIVIVWALMKYGPTSEVTDLLVVGAVAAVALKVAGRLNIGTAIDGFASGKTGILQTIETVFKQQTTTPKIGG
jgi:hypothetical protein